MWSGRNCHHVIVLFMYQSQRELSVICGYVRSHAYVKQQQGLSSISLRCGHGQRCFNVQVFTDNYWLTLGHWYINHVIMCFNPKPSDMSAGTLKTWYPLYTVVRPSLWKCLRFGFRYGFDQRKFANDWNILYLWQL